LVHFCLNNAIFLKYFFTKNVDYITTQWRSDAGIVAMTNVSSLEDMRTNNRVEGHNHRLALRLFGGHLNFWTFLALLRKEIIFQKLQHRQFLAGAKFRKRSAALQKREDHIKSLQRRYDSGAMDLREFVDAMINII